MLRPRSLVVVGLAAIAACAGKASKPPPDARAALPAVEAPKPPPRPPTPDFPAGTRSLRLTKTIAVRFEPGSDARQIGTIAIDTRVAWTKVEKAKGCRKPWVEIVPRGWVCGEYLEAQKRMPIGLEVPRLDRGEIVPGTYGKVVDEGAMIYGLPEVTPKDAKGKKGKGKKPPPPPPPDAGVDEPTDEPSDTPEVKVNDPMVAVRPILGSLNVRKYGEVAYGDAIYWKVSRGNEYVPAKSIHQHVPSTYQGVRLGDDTGMTLPIAFVTPKGQGTQIWTHKNAKGQGALRQLDARTAVSVLETAADANGKPTAYRIGDGEWVSADTVRVVQSAPPPPLIGPHERWVDVDLDRETLVAYEGTTPVYATLVSTGKKDTPTPTGIWRLWKKMAEQDMSGLSGEDPYSVATVPWTQFFDGTAGLALHAAYWHDNFGKVKSHGCVNLAPMDARWLYFWSEPIMPAGWTMTAGIVEAPGSIVRVRSAADPTPAYKGYAVKVQDARTSGAEPVPN